MREETRNRLRAEWKAHENWVPPVCRLSLAQSTHDEAQASHYSVLGIGPFANTTEIRAAYLALSRTKHPDRGAREHSDTARTQPLTFSAPELTLLHHCCTPAGGSNEEFIQIQEAWTVLSDPKARAAYDRMLVSAGARRC